MDKSERVLQKANADLNSAATALEISYSSLGEIESPLSGTITQLLASRTLFSSQRDIIKHNQEWVHFAKNQVFQAKEQLKSDMIQYEKFKYLELQEIKKIIDKQKVQEVKELDEIASITHTRNKKG
ncbi:flagellar export protein FliJ [bacterium]|nr:flagellar export protein FliJ [bacterium]MBU1989490.1 flagellar export protein FliJ [bacterium]